MKKLTSFEQNEIIQELKEKFNTDEVEYNGFNRFVLRDKYQLDLASGHTTWLYHDKLFDENSNQISLQNEYNAICRFINGVAIVIIYENIQFTENKHHKDEKCGLIDINGNELLPCKYDAIHIYMEGSIDITKNGQTKLTFVNDIINGEFDWDKI